MSLSVRTAIEAHWNLSNERSWDAFRALLHPALLYECPQTREYIEGAEGYVEMFRTWPGDWRAHITRLICQQGEGVSFIDFVVGAETMQGISVFEFDGGLVAKVTDYWPEDYEPPARATPHMKRRPA